MKFVRWGELLLLMILLSGVAFVASAEVRVEAKTFQKGYFRKCTDEPRKFTEEGDSYWDDCGCEANIAVPQIVAGLSEDVMKKINHDLMDEWGQDFCKGKQAIRPENVFSEKYETSDEHGSVMFENDNLLSTSWTMVQYGGNAPYARTTYYIFRKKDGKYLSYLDIFDRKKLSQLSRYIYKKIRANWSDYFEEDANGCIAKEYRNNHYYCVRANDLVNARWCHGCYVELSASGVVNIGWERYNTLGMSMVDNFVDNIPQKFLNPQFQKLLLESPDVINRKSQ
jgi:hypothetical protein